MGGVTRMEAHYAGSTIVGVAAAAEHAADSAFASIPRAKQAGEEIAIAATGPVDSGPKHIEGKAVAVVAAAAASEAAVGPIHSDSHFDRRNFPQMLDGRQ